MWIEFHHLYGSLYRVKDSTVKLELASQPWNFFRVLVYESVQAWLMVQSGCSSRLRNNSTRKSMALTCKILSKQKSHPCWSSCNEKWQNKKKQFKKTKKKETKYLVSHRSPFVQLEEPFAVLFWTSSWTMLYKCSYFAGSEKYLFSSLWQKRIKSSEIKKKITWNSEGSRSDKELSKRQISLK